MGPTVIYTEKIYSYLTLNSEAPSLTWRASPKEELSRDKRIWENTERLLLEENILQG